MRGKVQGTIRPKILVLVALLSMIMVSLSGCVNETHQYKYDYENLNMTIDEDGNVHVVWQQIKKGTARTYYNKIANDGKVLVKQKLLHAGNSSRHETRPQWLIDPDIAMAHDGDVLIVFSDNWEIYVTKLDNDGAFIITPIVISGDRISSDARAVVDSLGRLNVVYTVDNGTMTDLVHVVIDGSLTMVSYHVRTGRDYFDPSIVMSPTGDIYVCYGHEWTYSPWFLGSYKIQNLHVTHYDPTGDLVDHHNISKATNDQSVYSPEICIGPDDKIGIVYNNDSGLKYYPFDNHTAIMSSGVRYNGMVRENTSIHKPAVSYDGFSGYDIVWQDESSEKQSVYHARIDSSGRMFTFPHRLSPKSHNAHDPAIVTDEQGDSHITWVRTIGGAQKLWYMKLDRTGEVHVMKNIMIGDDEIERIVFSEFLLYGTAITIVMAVAFGVVYRRDYPDE